MTPSHSGPSDRLEASLAGFDVPAARPPDFPTADVSYAVDDTQIGRMLLACDGSGVLVASLFTPDAAAEEAALQRLAARISPRVLRRPQSLDEARRWLESYLDGGRPGAAPAWALSLATPFQIPVLTTLAARVGYGDRATYGQLASWAGRHRARRQPAVRRAPLPPRRRCQWVTHWVCRWAGRQALPPGVGVHESLTAACPTLGSPLLSARFYGAEYSGN